MAVSIVHHTKPAGSDSGDGKVSRNAWTEAHDLTTDVTDTSLVLAPDGAGGIEARPEAAEAAANVYSYSTFR